MHPTGICFGSWGLGFWGFSASGLGFSGLGFRALGLSGLGFRVRVPQKVLTLAFKSSFLAFKSSLFLEVPWGQSIYYLGTWTLKGRFGVWGLTPNPKLETQF